MELEHHGVKGQKWGVRRYQNYDGTLTDRGKLRYKGAVWKSNLIYDQLGKDVGIDKTVKKDDKNDFKEVNMKKGETVNHITPLEFKELRNGQDLYISADKKDQDTYKAFLSMMLKHKGFEKISEIKFQLKQDLKSPSNEQQKKYSMTFIKLIKKYSIKNYPNTMLIKNQNQLTHIINS